MPWAILQSLCNQHPFGKFLPLHKKIKLKKTQCNFYEEFLTPKLPDFEGIVSEIAMFRQQVLAHKNIA
jgi:hypothetical protein